MYEGKNANKVKHKSTLRCDGTENMGRDKSSSKLLKQTWEGISDNLSLPNEKPGFYFWTNVQFGIDNSFGEIMLLK